MSWDTLNKMGKPKCLSLESACIFGSTTFTLDTLLKLWDLTFSILLIGFNWSKYGNLVVRAHVVSAFFTSVYVTFSLILAFFLFKGIYRRLPGVIKLGAIFVLVLRLWECAGSLVSWDDGGVSSLGGTGSGPARDEFGVFRAAKIARFIAVNSSAVVFVTLLFLYHRQLLDHQHSKVKTPSRNSTSTLSF